MDQSEEIYVHCCFATNIGVTAFHRTSVADIVNIMVLMSQCTHSRIILA